ncbi:DNA adenine methylase [Mycoplasma crocodyli]|uniref:site-specific DNA-methyltransferase (adenine-specific) n=1 Tax=Mycoplasma crocodyli (strain ATCC 51981 / MP145) TaxID=512564 RepID=D5E6F8_MYCCM|nr:Dam family site-specific DNA-(adenine-N6)-methyltransferase [Mycoplasma crocodyli]ADE19829.1 adenine-specific DNA modification methyltransferase [Mycoplasma crocodyli MP145]
MERLTPFVKWVGGKRQLLNVISNSLPKFYNDYYEPFVGGGALLLFLKPKKAFINDINNVLINTYKIIKNNPDELINLLSKFDSSNIDKEKYNNLRNKFNKKIINQEFDVEQSALFIFLNKKCFNGLYRVNSKGLFNVPFNNKQRGSSFSKENILAISKYLKNVEILSVDFEKSVNNAKKGDFIFLDSPYVPLTETSFHEYSKEGFTLNDHIRLANLFKELDKRGCYVMLTNHNTELINFLYKDFNIKTVSVKRMINSDAKNRVGEEVIITNYEYQ